MINYHLLLLPQLFQLVMLNFLDLIRIINNIVLLVKVSATTRLDVIMITVVVEVVVLLLP